MFVVVWNTPIRSRLANHRRRVILRLINCRHLATRLRFHHYGSQQHSEHICRLVGLFRAGPVHLNGVDVITPGVSIPRPNVNVVYGVAFCYVAGSVALARYRVRPQARVETSGCVVRRRRYGSFFQHCVRAAIARSAIYLGYVTFQSILA